MADIDHPKIRRRDKKRKRAHLEELAQKDETDEGTAFYSTQYINDEELDENNLINDTQDSSEDGNEERFEYHDHDHDHENGNGIIYKVIFLILLVILGGISTLVLLENPSADVDSLEVGDSLHDGIQASVARNQQEQAPLSQNQNSEEDTLANRIVSFFDGLIDNSEHDLEHDDDHGEVHDENHDDDEHDHDAEDHNANDDGHSTEDDEQQHEDHGHSHEAEDHDENQIRVEFNDNLANSQPSVPEKTEEMEVVPESQPEPTGAEWTEFAYEHVQENVEAINVENTKSNDNVAQEGNNEAASGETETSPENEAEQKNIDEEYVNIKEEQEDDIFDTKDDDILDTLL